MLNKILNTSKEQLVQYPAIAVLSTILWSPFIANVMLGLLLIGIIINCFDKKYIRSVINNESLLIIILFLSSYVLYMLYGWIFDLYKNNDNLYLEFIRNKNLRLLLIPFLSIVFVEQDKKIQAVKIFTVSMVIFVVVHIFTILILGDIYSYFDKKTIITSFFLVFNLIVIYFLDIKSGYKLFNNQYIRWVIVLLFLIYLFVFCQGRTGQVLALLALVAAVWHNRSIKNIFLLLVFFWGLFIIPNSTFKKGITKAYNEGETYIIDNIDKGNKLSDVSNKDIESTNIKSTKIKPLPSVMARLEFYQYSIKLFLQKPLFGFGINSFKSSYAKIAKENFIQPTVNPHNQYLFILVELGIYGLLCFALFFSFITFSNKGPSEFRKIILASACLYLIGFLDNSLFNDFQTLYLFIMIYGILGSYDQVIKVKQ